MIGTILWNLMITAGFMSCIVVAAWIWFHFPDRTADDVVDFLLPVDLDKAESLLDASTETHLRCDLSRRSSETATQAHSSLCGLRKQNGA